MPGVLRRPAYTGANRCLPCTLLNVAIVLIVVALLLQISPEAAVVALFAGITATYLLGYVVPGTPTLTKRYLPDRVLDWFGNPSEASTNAAPGRQTTPDTPGMEGGTVGLDGVTVEATLLDAGALDPCRDRVDLCLDGEFRRAWDRELRNLPPDPMVDLTLLVGSQHVDDATLDTDEPPVTLRIGENQVGWWPSYAAFRADVAGAQVLSQRVFDWESYEFAERASILAGLRLWLERCPDCAGYVILDAEPVRSCCSDQEVLAMRCTNCDTRLLEVPQY